MNTSILRVSGIVVIGIIGAGAILLLEKSPQESGFAGARQPYIEIANPSGFLNTGTNAQGEGNPIMLKDLVGKKIILIDFLTYSCINCQRTFPHVNAWYDAYKNKGLEVIGIHTPEFAFEKNIDNVRNAMNEFGITHPIVLDNDYATWRAYGNQYWPRKYLIDIHGNIVYDHIGEGAYEETEKKIQELLAERNQVLGLGKVRAEESLVSSGIPTSVYTAKSPETYFGSDRNIYLANGVPGESGEHSFLLPQNYAVNALYVSGIWNVAPEYAETISDATVLYRYHAKSVYVVAESSTPAMLEVWQDGALVKTLVVQKSALYTIVENDTAGQHTLELRAREKGLRLFAFTFG